MTCEKCKKGEASVRMVVQHQGKPETISLVCSPCAEAMQIEEIAAGAERVFGGPLA